MLFKSIMQLILFSNRRRYEHWRQETIRRGLSVFEEDGRGRFVDDDENVSA